MKKIIKALLIIFGITLIIIALSINTFPEWLSIPGGILILLSITFKTVLNVGSKIKDWVDLLFSKEENNPNAESNYSEVTQQGGPNIIATNINHLEVYSSPSLNIQTNINNLTDKQKDALLSLVDIGHNWRDEFDIVWHEPVGLSDILDYDGNPPQISKGDVRALELEGLLTCKFENNDKAHITLMRKSHNVFQSFPIEAELRISKSERIENGVPYIGALITNADNNNLLKCSCVLKSITFNGSIDDELKYQITQHTSRISWSGGSDENVGVKYIDSGSKGELNLVSLRGIGRLVFETAKGESGNNLITGIYEIGLVLQGKIGDSDFRKKPFNICFEYLFEGEQKSVPFHGNTLSGNLGNYKIRLLDKE